MQADYGAAAPGKRLTSYRFFWRLSEVLIEQQLLIRGQRGRAARLVDITTLWSN